MSGSNSNLMVRVYGRLDLSALEIKSIAMDDDSEFFLFETRSELLKIVQAAQAQNKAASEFIPYKDSEIKLIELGADGKAFVNTANLQQVMRGLMVKDDLDTVCALKEAPEPPEEMIDLTDEAETPWPSAHGFSLVVESDYSSALTDVVESQIQSIELDKFDSVTGDMITAIEDQIKGPLAEIQAEFLDKGYLIGIEGGNIMIRYYLDLDKTNTAHAPVPVPSSAGAAAGAGGGSMPFIDQASAGGVDITFREHDVLISGGGLPPAAYGDLSVAARRSLIPAHKAAAKAFLSRCEVAPS